MKVEMPADTKYFSINESVSNYVQKYIVARKRKMFNGKGTEKDFLALCKNHSKEKYLFPCSDIRKATIPEFFAKHKLNFTNLDFPRLKSQSFRASNHDWAVGFD